MMITSINNSDDLAVVLNAPGLTSEDDAETPRDWLTGIWVDGKVYPLDEDATTQALAVLANGTAAARFVPRDGVCLHHTVSQVGAIITATGRPGHWCPADVDTWTEEDDARGVRRDWRTVTVWDANGFLEHTTHATVDQAKAAFDSEVAELEETAAFIGQDS